MLGARHRGLDLNQDSHGCNPSAFTAELSRYPISLFLRLSVLLIILEGHLAHLIVDGPNPRLRAVLGGRSWEYFEKFTPTARVRLDD